MRWVKRRIGDLEGDALLLRGRLSVKRRIGDLEDMIISGDRNLDVKRRIGDLEDNGFRFLLQIFVKRRIGDLWIVTIDRTVIQYSYSADKHFGSVCLIMLRKRC